MSWFHALASNIVVVRNLLDIFLNILLPEKRHCSLYCQYQRIEAKDAKNGQMGTAKGRTTVGSNQAQSLLSRPKLENHLRIGYGYNE